MASKADTFERKETKYLLTGDQARVIKEGLAHKMVLDAYGATRIDSLYYDTPDRSLICRSLEKPVYKEKLRVRSYGPFSEAQIVYIEIKKKFDGIVYKRRVRMSKEGARNYLAGMPYEQAQLEYPVPKDDAASDLEWTKKQISREIDAFLNRYDDLAPSMLISCLREAWAPIDPEDEDCVDRVTFDEDICYVDFFAQDSVARLHVTTAEQVVMEIKCAGGYPVWLCELLSDCGAFPRSFSKYGNAYKRVLAGHGLVQALPDASGKVAIARTRMRRRTESDGVRWSDGAVAGLDDMLARAK